MPHAASEISAAEFMRLLVLGSPKAGKSCSVIGTAPGFSYVINSDDKNSLRPVLEFSEEFEFDMVLGDNLRDIEKALATARDGVKSGKYQTIIWDTITKYCWRAEKIFAKATENKDGEPDGRRYHPKFRNHILNIIDRLFELDAHVIVNSHWADVGGAPIDNQLDKDGEGIAPMLPGQLRIHVPAAFQDVVFLERKGTSRNFITNAAGVWSPGSRNLPGMSILPASIEAVWASMKTHNETIDTKVDTSKKEPTK